MIELSQPSFTRPISKNSMPATRRRTRHHTSPYGRNTTILHADQVTTRRPLSEILLPAALRKVRQIESLGSTCALAEERGGLCNFVFFGPAFTKFLDTMHTSAPTLFDKANKSVVTQWKVIVDAVCLIHGFLCAGLIYPCETLGVQPLYTFTCSHITYSPM